MSQTVNPESEFCSWCVERPEDGPCELHSPFPTWAERHRAAATIVAEAYGWARNMPDPDDEEELLAWAKHYRRKIINFSQRGVTP